MKKDKIRTLVVDDSLFFQDAIKCFFESHPEIKLLGVMETGEDALEFIEKEKPDLIILDVRMSGMDGPQTARLIKGKYPWIKIIICTIWSENEAATYTAEAGADDYFVKGEPLPYLLKKIRVLFSC